MRFLYLCFDILDRRFFLMEPTVLLLYVIQPLKFFQFIGLLYSKAIR